METAVVKPVINGVEVKVGQVWKDFSGANSRVVSVRSDGTFTDDAGFEYGCQGTNLSGYTEYSFDKLIRDVEPIAPTVENTVQQLTQELGKLNDNLDAVYNDCETSVANKGIKYDEGKVQWWYLPIAPTIEVIKVLTYGDSKYPAEDGSNWKRVPNAKKRYYSALLRHVTAWWDGEKNDPETGLNHMAHAITNALFLLYFELKGYPDETKE